MPPEIRFEILSPSDPAYGKGYRYRLLADHSRLVPVVGKPEHHEANFLSLVHVPGSSGSYLTIRAGYCWDGPSGPAVDTVNFLRASLIHDALYQLLREGVLSPAARATADRVLREISEEDGMGLVRRWIDWLGVRLFAGPAARKV